jgi:hypothetical protein
MTFTLRFYRENKNKKSKTKGDRKQRRRTCASKRRGGRERG